MKATEPAILGGEPIRLEPFAERRTMGAAEREAAIKVLDSDVLSAFLGGAGQYFMGGEHVRRFEQAWAEQFGFKHAISVNSWTSGLMAAVGACGIGPGDEVIVSPYTMSASATCVLFYGGIPIFADIDPDNYCLDPASVEARVTPRTKAIIVVHIFGHPADMDGIMEVARKHQLRVIEDAAQSPGATYKGRPVGAIGDIGGFSLNYHKHIHVGEGGLLVTQDDTLARRACLIRNHGENAVEGTDEPLDNAIGGNYRLTELQAAIACEQLRKLDIIVQTRQQLAAHVRRRLDGLPGLRVQAEPTDSTHAYYVLPLRFDAEAAGLSRHLFVKSVLAELPPAKGFESMPLTEGFVRPLYLSRIYQEQRALGSGGFPFNYNEGVTYAYPKGLCPVAEEAYEHSLLLSPLVRDPLNTADMDDLCAAIEKVLENAETILTRCVEDAEDILTPLNAANRTRVR